MKRFILISTTALVAICISFSCQKEEQTGENPGKGKILTVTAKIGNVSQDTKTYIDGAESPIKTYWSEGDKIKLFDEGGNAAVYKISSWTAKQTSATFVLDDGQTALSGTFHCACYPADSSKWEDEDVVFGLPSVQAYVSGTGGYAGSFGNGAAPMVATGTLDETKGNLDLTFRNACGVLQLNLTSSEVITRIAVASLDKGYYLFGDASIFDIDEPTCSLSQGYHQIEMDILSGEAPSSARAYYMVLPETKSHAETAGLRIAVTTTGGLYYKDLTTRITRDTITCLAAKNIQNDFTKATYSEATDSAAVMVEGMIWAPVNCGYVKDNYNYGKLYQWGRKAGRGYNDSETYTEPILQTATEAKFNSTTGINDSLNVAGFNNWFYSYGSAPNDWYANDASKQLKSWPMKSGDDDYVEGKIANPCPDGWRVPTYAELDALTGNGGTEGIGSAGWDSANKGYWFNGTKSPKSGEGLFLPAAGYCDYYGSAESRGFYGEYWSSSVDGSDARYMEIYNNNAYMTSYNRAYGFSVRCVQE